MEYETLFAMLSEYEPVCPQEETDRRLMLSYLSEQKCLLTRENETMHFTASAWVTDAAHTHVLMAYHNIYRSYAWLGGHADGNSDLFSVAREEVLQESGLAAVFPLGEKPISLEILPVCPHEKRGRFVAAHLHLNVTYGFFADKTAPLRIKPDENSALQWFVKEDAPRASREAEMRVIYEKLNRRI